MAIFSCAGCEAKEREIERLHAQLKHAMDLRFEAAAPGAARRVAAANAPPAPAPPRRPRPANFPGYEQTGQPSVVEFVESPGEG